MGMTLINYLVTAAVHVAYACAHFIVVIMHMTACAAVWRARTCTCTCVYTYKSIDEYCHRVASCDLCLL